MPAEAIFARRVAKIPQDIHNYLARQLAKLPPGFSVQRVYRCYLVGHSADRKQVLRELRDQIEAVPDTQLWDWIAVNGSGRTAQKGESTRLIERAMADSWLKTAMMSPTPPGPRGRAFVRWSRIADDPSSELYELRISLGATPQEFLGYLLWLAASVKHPYLCLDSHNNWPDLADTASTYPYVTWQSLSRIRLRGVIASLARSLDEQPEVPQDFANLSAQDLDNWRIAADFWQRPCMRLADRHPKPIA